MGLAPALYQIEPPKRGEHASLLAGVSAVDITPSPGLPLQGHVGAGPSRGVLYPLEARAVVFRQSERSAAIVTLDVIGVTLGTAREMRREIFARTGIAPERVMVAASHTHCAPATLPCLGLAPDERFMRALTDSAAGAVAAAAKALEPVTLGLGCGSAHFNVNRRPLPGTTEMAPNFGAIADRRARLLRLDRADGTPLGVMFHYSCHPTAKSGKDGLVSPDYPGVARARIERVLGCRAMFLAGCCGNVRPLIVDGAGAFTSADKDQLDRCGHELGDAVIAAAQSTRTRPAGELDSAQRAVRFPYASHDSTDAPNPPAGETSLMQAMRIGPLLLIAMPGEPVQEIGHAVERAIRNNDDAPDVWPVGYANDMLGYFCTARHHAEGGYEPNAYGYFGRPAPFAGEEALIVTTALELCADVQGRARVVAE